MFKRENNVHLAASLLRGCKQNYPLYEIIPFSLFFYPSFVSRALNGAAAGAHFWSIPFFALTILVNNFIPLGGLVLKSLSLAVCHAELDHQQLLITTG